MTEPKAGPEWVPARAAVHLARRREIDWSTTIIAAGSFLFHFGAFSTIYSDWADPPIDDDLVIAQLVEDARQLPSAPAVEEPEQVPTVGEERPAATVSRTEPRGEKSGPTRGTAPAQSKAGRPDAASIASELDRMNVAMLASLRSSGPSTDRVLDSSTISFAELDAAAGQAVATRPGITFGGGSAYRPGGSQTLADLGNQGRSDAAPSRGRSASTKLQVPAWSLPNCPKEGACDPPPAEVPNAPQVIASLQGMFRRCYQNGLDREDPDMAGSVRVTAKIGPNGEVVSTSASASGTVTSTVASCIASKVQGAQFSAPTNGQGAVLVIPVGLKKQ